MRSIHGILSVLGTLGRCYFCLDDTAVAVVVVGSLLKLRDVTGVDFSKFQETSGSCSRIWVSRPHLKYPVTVCSRKWHSPGSYQLRWLACELRTRARSIKQGRTDTTPWNKPVASREHNPVASREQGVLRYLFLYFDDQNIYVLTILSGWQREWMDSLPTRATTSHYRQEEAERAKHQ